MAILLLTAALYALIYREKDDIIRAWSFKSYQPTFFFNNELKYAFLHIYVWRCPVTPQKNIILDIPTKRIAPIYMNIIRVLIAF